MARYGTILIIYDNTNDKIEAVKSILDNHRINFLLKETSYFFKTLSLSNRDKITKQLKEKNFTFLLFHNSNSDGDRIKANNLLSGDLKTIKEYVIEE